MSTPPKPVSVLRAEGKSHRTKQELAMREKAEAGLLSGVVLKESKTTKDDPLAHKEFKRVKSLLETIGKADDLYQGIVNRYCQMTSEVSSMQKTRAHLEKAANNYRDSIEDVIDEGVSIKEAYNTLGDLNSQLLQMDKQIDAKRKDLIAMEKELCLTLASSLRAIPKTPEKSGNPLLEALGL